MKSPEEFIERIRRSFLTPSSKDERIKVVLICLIISTTFWFFSELNQDDYITQISYPIEFIYDEDDYMAVGELPDRMMVEVTGGGWDLMTRSFGLNMKPLVVDLARPAEVKAILTSSLRGDLTPNLDPVAVNFILDDSIRFDIQKRVSRTLQLKLDQSSIDLATDHILDSNIGLVPSILTVEGPEELLSQLGDTLAIAINENNIDEDFSQNVDIPNLGEYISAEFERVSVSFDVETLVTVAYDYPIELINAPKDSWEILPNYLPVRVKLKSSLFDATDTSMFGVQVDFNKMSPDSLLPVELINIKKELMSYSFKIDSVKVYRNE